MVVTKLVKGEEGAVPLVLLARAVRQVVTDKPGVNTVAVLTTEIARLGHVHVQIQRSEVLLRICRRNCQILKLNCFPLKTDINSDCPCYGMSFTERISNVM